MNDFIVSFTPSRPMIRSTSRTGRACSGARSATAGGMIPRDRARVVMPPAVALLAPLHALPVRLVDRIIGLLGVNDTMKTFTGRH